jgi:CBS domain containing-hemolysin-like protein
MLPLVKTLAWLSDAFRRGQRVIGTEDQIRSLVKMGWRSGYIEPDEGHMIHRTFLLNDRTAQEVMTELADTVSIPSDASVEDAVAVVRANKFTRYPVLGQTPDDVLGIVIARDVLQAMLNGQAAESVVSLVQPAFVVDAEARIDDLLVEFRARHQHLAVVQHNQKTVGIVTLENAVEQIVGDIKDETDMTIE